MSLKSDVSNRHLQQLVKTYGSLPIPRPPHVLLTGDARPQSIGQAIRKTLRLHRSVIRSYVGDVREPIDTPQFAGMDTLILCHGVTHLAWFEDTTDEKAREIFDVNLTASYRLMQTFVRASMTMPVRKRIVLIGSMAHKAVLNGSAAYCASKAGLAHLARCAAWELAPKGFDVFILHPSNVKDTPMTEETIMGLMRYRGLTRGQAVAYWNDSSIRESILTAEEIAELTWWLLSGPSQYLSGTQLDLAGGQR